MLVPPLQVTEEREAANMVLRHRSPSGRGADIIVQLLFHQVCRRPSPVGLNRDRYHQAWPITACILAIPALSLTLPPSCQADRRVGLFPPPPTLVSEAGPVGCGPLVRPGSLRGCRSSWFRRSDAPAVPAIPVSPVSVVRVPNFSFPQFLNFSIPP